MPRISLLGGAYQDGSLIAAAQRCINLFPEDIPRETKEGVEAVHRLRPGFRFLSAPPALGRGRGVFTANNGDVYAVVDQQVFYVNPDFVHVPVGALIGTAATPVSFADNNQDIVLVDGSPQGYDINMTTRAMTQIADPNFQGADRVDYLDSFFTFNEPNSPNWYISLSNVVAFNALDFGSKTAWPDNIVAQITIEREEWLLGSRKGEVWFNASAPGFPFQGAPGVIIEFGCCAKYSVAKQDVKIYWLSQSPEGNRMVMCSEGHGAKRISTHAIETEFKKYPRVDDAIGGTYQIEGHGFYALHFPTADRSWFYDEATKQWHEQRYCDTNGNLHRSRAAFYAFGYDTNIAQDWATGTLYAIDLNTYTDQLVSTAGGQIGSPICWVRSLPHMPGDKFERITYNWLIADVEVGTGLGTSNKIISGGSPFSSGFSSGFGPFGLPVEPPLISLRYSDDRGATWGNYILQNLGAQGEYNTTVTYWNLGMSRDKILELSGSTSQRFSLLGVYLPDLEYHES